MILGKHYDELNLVAYHLFSVILDYPLKSMLKIDPLLHCEDFLKSLRINGDSHLVPLATLPMFLKFCNLRN